MVMDKNLRALTSCVINIRRCNVEPETVAAIVFFLGSIYVMTTLQIFSDRRHIHYYGDSNINVSLPDVGHETLMHFDNERMLDLMVNTLAFVSIFMMFFSNEPQRNIRRLLWIQSVILTIRGVVLFVTTLPNPYTSACINPDGENLFLLAIKVAFRVAMTCSDILVSGHSVTACSASIMLTLYVVHSRPVILAVLWLYTGTILVFIVASRYHYTADVVLGVSFTFMVYALYHYAAALAHRDPEAWFPDSSILPTSSSMCSPASSSSSTVSIVVVAPPASHGRDHPHPEEVMRGIPGLFRVGVVIVGIMDGVRSKRRMKLLTTLTTGGQANDESTA